MKTNFIALKHRPAPPTAFLSRQVVPDFRLDSNDLKSYYLSHCVCVFMQQTVVRFLTYAMIEITCNDRLGKKVRVKCKYPLRAAIVNIV